MNRRDSVTALLALGAAAGPFAAFAQQQPGKVRRILHYTVSAQTKDSFAAGMRDLGWIEGRNVSVKVNVAQEVDEAALRLELLDRNQPVDAVVMAGPLRIRAAMNVTGTVPIIGIDLESDPVAGGFVKSRARPGANVSGVWMDLPELIGKHLQLLREAVPRLARVGVVWDDRFTGPQFAHADAVARASNLRLSSVAIHGAVEVANAVGRLLAQRAQALLVLSSPTIFLSLQRVAELARDHRLPSICLSTAYADAGGILSCGLDFCSMYRRLAGYVDRILKGARVGDLLIERPTKFELVINLKTARALGLTIPQSVLQRADRVIE